MSTSDRECGYICSHKKENCINFICRKKSLLFEKAEDRGVDRGFYFFFLKPYFIIYIADEEYYKWALSLILINFALKLFSIMKNIICVIPILTLLLFPYVTSQLESPCICIRTKLTAIH